MPAPENQWDVVAANLVKFTASLVKKQKENNGLKDHKDEAIQIRLYQNRASSQVEKFRSLLHLNQNESEFQGVEGFPPVAERDYTKIYVTTRSLNQVLIWLAQFVQVPEEHQDQGRATRSLFAANFPGTVQKKPFHVSSSPMPPQDTYAKIKYQDHWFYIADTDLTSKDIIAMMVGIFTMLQPVSKEKPTVTLPVR